MSPAEYYHHDSEHPVGDVVKAWGMKYNQGVAIAYIARAGLKTPDPGPDCLKAIHHLLMELSSCECAGACMVEIKRLFRDWGVVIPE